MLLQRGIIPPFLERVHSFPREHPLSQCPLHFVKFLVDAENIRPGTWLSRDYCLNTPMTKRRSSGPTNTIKQQHVFPPRSPLIESCFLRHSAFSILCSLQFSTRALQSQRTENLHSISHSLLHSILITTLWERPRSDLLEITKWFE